MSNFLDEICKLRDILKDKNYKKLELYNFKISQIKEQLIRLMKKKTYNYNFNLDITSQDLRELSDDISNLIKYWDTQMNPAKNIKKIFKISKDNGNNKLINFDEWTKTKEPIMRCRTRTMQSLIELLSISQFFAVYLYYVELVIKDEIAIKYTERLF